jgi:hypothetical protein
MGRQRKHNRGERAGGGKEKPTSSAPKMRDIHIIDDLIIVGDPITNTLATGCKDILCIL